GWDAPRLRLPGRALADTLRRLPGHSPEVVRAVSGPSSAARSLVGVSFVEFILTTAVVMSKRKQEGCRDIRQCFASSQKRSKDESSVCQSGSDIESRASEPAGETESLEDESTGRVCQSSRGI
ncbi:unnamed protein product, partial [Gadus morhua 'NCC']